MRLQGPAHVTGGATTDGALLLGRHPAEVERGRRHVADACRDYPGDVAGTAMLLASELITNALRHGDGPITVLVLHQAGRVRVEVGDDSPMRPQARRSAVDDEGGRGLFIVETLAADWGVDRTSRGRRKTVWFVLDAA